MRLGTLGLLVAVTGAGLASSARAEMPSCYVAGLVASTIATTKVADSITATARGLDAAAGLGCDLALGREFLAGAFARGIVPDVRNALTKLEPSWQAGARLGVHLNAGAMVYGLAAVNGTTWRLADVKGTTTQFAFGGGLELELPLPGTRLVVEYQHAEGGSLAPATDSIRVGVAVSIGQPAPATH